MACVACAVARRTGGEESVPRLAETAWMLRNRVRELQGVLSQVASVNSEGRARATMHGDFDATRDCRCSREGDAARIYGFGGADEAYRCNFLGDNCSNWSEVSPKATAVIQENGDVIFGSTNINEGQVWSNEARQTNPPSSLDFLRGRCDQKRDRAHSSDKKTESARASVKPVRYSATEAPAACVRREEKTEVRSARFSELRLPCKNKQTPKHNFLNRPLNSSGALAARILFLESQAKERDTELQLLRIEQGHHADEFDRLTKIMQIAMIRSERALTRLQNMVEQERASVVTRPVQIAKLEEALEESFSYETATNLSLSDRLPSLIRYQEELKETNAELVRAQDSARAAQADAAEARRAAEEQQHELSNQSQIRLLIHDAERELQRLRKLLGLEGREVLHPQHTESSAISMVANLVADMEILNSELSRDNDKSLSF